MIFKVTRKTQYQALGGLILTTAFFLLFFFGIAYVSGSIKIAILTLVPLYSLFYLLPVVILHNNYLKYGKGIKASLTEFGIEVNGRKYDADNIVSFEMYSTIQRKRKRGSAATLAHNEYYYYIKMNLKTSKPVILNSLLGVNIDDALKKFLPKIPFNYHLNFFSGLMITESSFKR